MKAYSVKADRPCAACRLRAVDPLTGLADRWAWEEQAPRLFHEAQRTREQVALLLVDLDEFKSINDTWGHRAGDAMLAGAGDVLRQYVPGDRGLVGRYGGHGGDEFLVLLPRAGKEEALRVAEDIRAGVQSVTVAVTATSGDRTVFAGISASVGLTLAAPETDRALEHLVLSADAALQQAKRGGRDRVHIASAAEADSAELPVAELVSQTRRRTLPRAC